MKEHRAVERVRPLEQRQPAAGIALLDRRSMVAQSLGFLRQMNSTLTNMDAPIETLSGGQRQAVAICRTLRWKAEIIIMDEPTAALGVRETEQVLRLIQTLKDNGVTVILISHNMNDIIAVADRVTILDAGRTRPALPTDDMCAHDLSRLIMDGSRAEPTSPVQ